MEKQEKISDILRKYLTWVKKEECQEISAVFGKTAFFNDGQEIIKSSKRTD